MAINLKTQVAIDVELNTQFKEAQDFKLVTTAAVALADAIENIGRAHLQTEKGYKAHIKLLEAVKQNLTIGSEEYLQYVNAIAQTDERLKSLTKTHEAEAKAAAIANNSAALTTKQFEKSISVIDKAIQQRQEHLGILTQEAARQIASGEIDNDFLNYLDEQQKLLKQTIELKNKLTQMLQDNTVAVDINSQAQQILGNAYKSTVNGIAAQKKALTEVFNELTDNDEVLSKVAAGIRKLDEETQQFTQHLQTTYTSAEAYSKALELMKTKTSNTTNEIDKQKNTLAGLLGFIELSSEEYSKVKTEIEQLTQQLQTTYTSSEAYGKALDLMKTKTFNTTNEIEKQKNALAGLLGFIQIGSQEYSQVKTAVDQLTQQQKIANNEFLKGSTVLKHFFDQFAGSQNTSSFKQLTSSLDKLNKDLAKATDEAKIAKLQEKIKKVTEEREKISKPIRISEMTDVDSLKGIIEAVELLKTTTESQSTLNNLIKIFEEARVRIDVLTNTTQNANTAIDAVLANIKSGLTDIVNIKPIDFLNKFKNIEQVNAGISRLQALQDIIPMTLSAGEIRATRPDVEREIQNLIASLQKLKEDMTKVVSLQEKPLNLTEELQKLQKTVPPTVAAVNELNNAYEQLLNKVQVKAKSGDPGIFTIDPDDIKDIQQIQIGIEQSAFAAQKLKREFAEIFVGLKGEDETGLDALLTYAEQARSVNELQAAISKLESVRNELPLLVTTEESEETLKRITSKIKELKQTYEALLDTFNEEPLNLTQELKKVGNTIPTTVAAINQLENAYAQLLNKVSVQTKQGDIFNRLELFNIDPDDIKNIQDIQFQMEQSAFAAQKLKGEFAEIFVGLKGEKNIPALQDLLGFANQAKSVNELQLAISRLESVQSNLPFDDSKETIKIFDLITKSIDELTQKQKALQDTFIQKPLTLTLSEELNKLKNTVSPTVSAINELSNAYAELLNKVSVKATDAPGIFTIAEDDIQNIREIQHRIEDSAFAAQRLKTEFAEIFVDLKGQYVNFAGQQKKTGLDNLLDFANQARSVNELQLALSKLESVRGDLPLLQADEKTEEILKEITNAIENLRQKQQQLQDTFEQKPITLTLSEELQKLQGTVPPTVDEINKLSNAYAELLNKVSVQSEGLELFTIAEDDIKNIQEIQHGIEKSAFAAQMLKREFTEIFVGLKGEGSSNLDNLLDFAKQAKSVNELQAAISKLQNVRNDLPLLQADSETSEKVNLITKAIEELEQKYKALQDTFKEKPLTLTEELQKLQGTVPLTVSAINELSSAYAELLNKVSVKATDAPGIFTIAEDDIQNIREIQHRIEESAFAAQKLKGEFAEIFVGLKGEQRITGLDNLLYFADQAKSVNELQLALSRLQSVQSDLSYIPDDEKTVEVFDRITRKIDELTQKHKELQESFKQELPFNPSTDGINQYISELQKLKNSFTEAERQLYKYERLLSEINKQQVTQQLGQIRDQGQKYQLGAIDEALGVGKTEFEDFNLAQLESYLQLLERLQKHTTNNKEEFDKLAGRIKEVNEQLQIQQSVGQETLSFWEQLKRRIMGVDTELDSLQMGSEDFLQTIEMVSYQFDNFLTRGIGDSIRGFADIQAEILRVTATAGDATEAEMTKIAQTATMAASATSQEVANIMLIGARAGLDKTQIEQFTQPIIAGMEATGTTAETMASTVIDSLRAFRIPFSDAMKTVDLFTNVANKSNQEVKDIADAMRYVGPYAASLNVDITDLGAVLAILANAGIRGTEAGTGLRMALSRLSIAANATSGETLGLTENQDRLFKVMQQLGINIRDKQGNLKSLVDILVMLKKETENYTSTQKAELVTALFGIEAAGKLIAALNLTEIELRMTGEQIANNTGLTKKLQQEINGTDYALKQFSNSLSLMSVEFGKAFATAMLPFTKGLTELFNGFNKMSPEAKQVAASIAALTAAFVILISTVAVYLALKPQLIQASLLFGQALGTVAGAVKGLTAAYTGLFAAQISGGGILAMVAGFGKIAIAIAAVTAAVYVLSKAFGDADEEKEKFANENSWQGLENVLLGINAILNSIKEKMQWIAENTPDLPDVTIYSLPGIGSLAGIGAVQKFKKETEQLQKAKDELKRLFPDEKKKGEDPIQLQYHDYQPMRQIIIEAQKSNKFTEQQLDDLKVKFHKDLALLFALGYRQSAEVNKLLQKHTPTQITQDVIKGRLELFKEAQKLVQGIQKNQFNPADFFENKNQNERKIQLERLKTALYRIGGDYQNTIQPLVTQLDTLFNNPTDDAITNFQGYIGTITDNQKKALAKAVDETVKVNQDAIDQINKSFSNAIPATEKQTEMQKMLVELDKIRAKAIKDETKAREDASFQRTELEIKTIDKLKEINIEAANSIDKYKKDNIEKLAKFTIEKERQIQEAKLQIQKNELTTLRNKQDYEVSMEMISRRLRGEPTTDLEYKYRLERILQDKEQALEDVRYNRIKQVKDLEQEIIDIRKQGEKDIYEIWSTLWKKRQETITDAQKQDNEDTRALGRKLKEISETAANALQSAYGSGEDVKNFTPTIKNLGSDFYTEDINRLLKQANLTKEQFEIYRNVLHFRETRGVKDPYTNVNPQGFKGAYQFGGAAQTDAINLANKLKLDTKGLTGEITNIKPLDQEKLLLLTIGAYRQQLEKYINNFNELPLNVQIGLLFASHGHGAAATAEFYKKGTNRQDENKVKLGDTLEKGKKIIQQQGDKQSILPTPKWRLATNGTSVGIGGTASPLVVPTTSIAIPPPPPIPSANEQALFNLLQNSETQFDTSIKTNIPDVPIELKNLGEEQIKPFVDSIQKVIAVTKELQQSEIDLTSSESLQKYSDYANDIVNPVTQISDNYYSQQKLLQEQRRLMAEGVKPELIEQTAQLNIQKQTESARLTTLQQKTAQLILQTQENIKQNNLSINELDNAENLTAQQETELKKLQEKNKNLNESLITLTDIKDKTQEAFDLNEKLPELIAKQRIEFEKLAERQQLIKDLSTGIANSLGEGLRESLNLLINGSENWGLALENIVVRMLNQIIDQLLYITVIQPFVKGAGDFLGNIFGNLFGGGGGGVSVGLGEGIAGIAGLTFADGGIMTGYGSMPLKRYARGGIANSPQLAMFGEGSKPEAYVPLPDGRSIPVTIKGFADGGIMSLGAGTPLPLISRSSVTSLPRIIPQLAEISALNQPRAVSARLAPPLAQISSQIQPRAAVGRRLIPPLQQLSNQINTYASGGIARSPQLALFGEGSLPEAYVPLPDGRSIPVTMRGSINNSDNKTTINNINVTVSTDSSQTQGSDSKSRRLGEDLALKIQQEIIRQQRPGGLLA